MARSSRQSSLLTGAVAALTLAGCGSGSTTGSQPASRSEARAANLPGPAAPSSPSSPAMDPVPREDAVYETVLAPVRDVQVSALIEGQIVQLAVEEGQRVAEGARLAQLDDREQKATLDEAEPELSSTHAAWERSQRLRTQSVISEEQFLEARSQWQRAQARRDRARVEWERCSVRAPISGVVVLRKVQVGQRVERGEAMFRISDPDRLRAELLLPEAKLGTVRPGQEVTIMAASGDAMAQARVSRVSPMVDPESGTFRVVIDLDNRRARMTCGITARVRFEEAAASSPPSATR